MCPCDPLPARDQRMSKNPASNSYRPTLPLGILFAEIITAPNAQEHVPSLARHGLNPPVALFTAGRVGAEPCSHRTIGVRLAARAHGFRSPPKSSREGRIQSATFLEHALSLMVRL